MSFKIKRLFFVLSAIIMLTGSMGGRVYGEEIPAESADISSKASPMIEKPLRTSKGTVKLKWQAVSGADRYRIYRRASSDKEFKMIAETRKTSYTDKKGKALMTYYYKVAAVFEDAGTGELLEGKASSGKKVKVRKKAGRIAFVGDSIMTGFDSYHVVTKSEKVYAKIGMHASNFYDSDKMQQMLQWKPDRMFMMFGMNGLVGSPTTVSMDEQIDYMGKIIKKCRKKNRNMEIIILGVSPVSGGAHVKLSSIKTFNKRLKKAVKKWDDVHYYDLADVLADENGYLKRGYSGGDGIHWSPDAYKKVHQALNTYVKEWK